MLLAKKKCRKAGNVRVFFFAWNILAGEHKELAG
jgi:hypothetical protein